MNEIFKTITNLLEAGKPELQVAAAQILGELRVKDPNVVRALAQGLRRSPVLARFCVDALAKIQTDEATEVVARAAVELDALGDHAAHLVGDLGSHAHAVLAAAYPEAVIEQRRRILQMLSRHVSKESQKAFNWAIHPEGFSAPELHELGRLQAWTLKPARLR